MLRKSVKMGERKKLRVFDASAGIGAQSSALERLNINYEDDGEPFEEKMARLTAELSEMFKKSHELEEEIRKKLGAIGYEI